MNTNELFKNILAYQKAGFENAFNSAVTIQNKTQGWLDENLENVPFFSEQGKEWVKTWMNTVTETRDGYKQFVSEQQNWFETLWNRS